MNKANIVSFKKQHKLYLLHKLLDKLEAKTFESLPAAHSLTGCDTVANIGTKKSMLKAVIEYSDLLQSFGSDRLDEDIILSAENFLVKVIAPKKLSSCETFDDLRVKLHRKSMVKKYIDLS